MKPQNEKEELRLVVRMLTRVVFTAVVLAALSWVSQAQGADTADSLESLIKGIRSRVVIDRPYEIGSPIELELDMGQAARLKPAKNSFGLEEILICPKEGTFFHYTVWSDGTIAGGGRRTGEQFNINSCTPAPTLSFVKGWEVQDSHVKVSYQATTDAGAIKKRRIEQVKKATEQERKEANTTKKAALPQADRVAGFARLWSEVKYNFVFFDRVPELNWDKVLEEYLPKVEAAESAEAYYRVLQECLVKLHDGHTDVGVTGGPRCCLPVWLEPIEGKAVITSLWPTVESKEIFPERTDELTRAGLKLGEEITHIDGRPVSEILAQDIYPYVSASTPQGRDQHAFRQLLRGKVDSVATLQVRDVNGQTREVTLTRGVYSPKGGGAAFETRTLPGNVRYVALRGFTSDKVVEQFDSILDKIREASGLIIDVRENGGGSTDNGYAIISRLIDKPLKGSHWKTRKYIPTFRAWGRPEAWYKGDHGTIDPWDKKPYLGHVVVLMGPKTVSAAEDFLVALHAGRRATLVGEKSAGTTGQPLVVELPGGASARICTKHDMYPDGREFVGIGVIPDVEAHQTQADVAAGRDAILEKGLETLRAMADNKA